MKAWMFATDDPYWEELLIFHAETRGKAKAHCAAELGILFLEASVRRVPAMDDKPITSWNLLITASCSWVECDGCNRHIQADDPPYSYDDDDEVTLAVPWRQFTYCSAACLERDRHRMGWRYVDV